MSKKLKISQTFGQKYTSKYVFFFMQYTPDVPNNSKIKNDNFFSWSSSGMPYLWGIFKNWLLNKLQCCENFTTFWSIVDIDMSTTFSTKVLIIAKNHVAKPALCRTRLSFKRRAIFIQVMVTVVEGILVMAKTKRKNVVGPAKGIYLEWQTLTTLLTIEFTVLMGFGWLIMTNVIPGVMLQMYTPTVSIMLPIWLWPLTISLTLIHSKTIFPPITIALECPRYCSKLNYPS